MSHFVEHGLLNLIYQLSQWFLLPVLLALTLLFFHAFFALGFFLRQARQRRRQQPAAFELLAAATARPQLTLAELEGLAVERLETARLSSRVAPMLGLVATMIPLGPTLQALAAGQLAEMARQLTVAFSAVILALLAASLSYWIVTVRRRWYAGELALLEKARGVGA